MPVLTRSKKLIMKNNLVTYSWLSNYLQKIINIIDEQNKKRKEINKQLKTEKKVRIINRLEKDKRDINFNLYRLTSEFFYNARTYIPEIYNVKPCLDNFIKNLYNKIQELYESIRTEKYKNLSVDEYLCTKVLLNELQDSEKILIKYLDPKQIIKNEEDDDEDEDYDPNNEEDLEQLKKDEEYEKEFENELRRLQEEEANKVTPKIIMKNKNHIIFEY